MAKSDSKRHAPRISCACGGAFAEGHVDGYDATDALELRVKLVGKVPGLLCNQCGTFMVSMDAVEAAARAACMELLTRDQRLSGNEVRFLRKNVARVSQDELAETIGVGRRTLVRWEQQDSLNPDTDYLLRSAFVGALLQDVASDNMATIHQTARLALRGARPKRAPKRPKAIKLDISRGFRISA